ncbi:hypothetical protein BH10ACI1_BH10ACI1_10610 [soil metagenome]
MKKYRRIEITAFRRRVQIISGESNISDTNKEEEIRLNDADTQSDIVIESAEGQRILTEVVRLLEEKLAGGMRKGS